ncbi:hypothetical protein D1007_38623 [Hordeum vulgare]|nr:hypothetical protein D1007_38623 [Hordeum vulgare]KAI4985975.1 hypothetical protein ZWY2020_018605 [Hordeum vulgare]
MPGLFARGDVHVYLGAGGPSERHPDLVVVRRRYYGRESTVYRAGATVAQVHRKLQTVEYDVRVNAGVDHAFLFALTVILEEIRVDDIKKQ